MKKHIIGYSVLLFLTVALLAMAFVGLINPDMGEFAAVAALLYFEGMISVGSIYAGIYIRYMWFVPFLPLVSLVIINFLYHGTVIADYWVYIPLTAAGVFTMLQWALIAWGVRTWRKKRQEKREKITAEPE